jgi:spore coat protein U-like protein
MKKTILAAILFVIALPSFASNCTWRQLPTDLVFGNYSVFSSANLTATGSYQFNCTPNTAASITFSVGQNATSYLPRYMAWSGNMVPYNVYDDAAMTLVMGDGTGGTTVRNIFNSTTTTKLYTDSYYGKLTQGSDIPASPAGTYYTDVVTITVAWSGGSISATFNITTAVLSECTMSAAALAFNNYDPVVANAVAPLDSSSSVTAYCTKSTAGSVTMDNGLYFTTTRRMAGPVSSFLNYGLFSDSGRATPWASVAATSISKNTPIGLTVYGRVPGGQDPAAGSYSDTVQATINY